MPKITATAGQLLVNDVLPAEMRDYSRVVGKKELTQLMSELARNHPEEYRRVSYRLMQLAKEEAYRSGGFSVGLSHLKKSPAAKRIQEKLNTQIDALLNSDIPSEQLNERIIELTQAARKEQDQIIFQEALDEKNPLALQVIGSGKGKPANIASLRGFDGLYEDHRGRAIPVPVTQSYSEGLSPMSYWASSYGGRKGVIDVKIGVANSGYLSKQIAQMIHRQLVTADDREEPSSTPLGFPVPTDDQDNVGALLAQNVAGYPRNTVLTQKILDDLKKRGHEEILVRSPILSGAPDGGLYAKDVGLREFGRLPLVGENVSMAAGQSVGERLAQIALSSKHSGGVAGANKLTVGGFDAVNMLFQSPKIFKGGSIHAGLDGRVQEITDAPAGGKYITIAGQQHYVPEGMTIRVQSGQEIEAGDILTDGLPNPTELVHHKGVGEARRYFVKALSDILGESGIRTSRRNLEIMARGAINHVRMDQEYGGHLVDDVVPYSVLEHQYQPREGHQRYNLKKATGKYLERPYLHYTIGTRVTPSVARQLEKFGVTEVDAHEQPPPFTSVMIPAARNLRHDPDWLVQMYGSGLKDNLLKSVHTGRVSDQAGTSFVPAAAYGVEFGRVGKVRYSGKPVTHQSEIPKNPNQDLYLTDRDDTSGESSEVLDADDLDRLFE